MADDGYMLNADAVRKIRMMWHWFIGGGDPDTVRGHRPRQGPPVRWGKLTADWSAETPNQVTVNLCTQDGIVQDAVSTFTIHLATPLDEEPTSCTLVTGDVIAFVPMWDVATQGQRGIMIGGGQPGTLLLGKAAAIWTNDATATGNGSYVNVHPCLINGTEEDAEITRKVWLPRNGRREDPNVQDDWVISYQPESGGDYCNPSGCLDGKIYETVRFHQDMTNIPGGWSEIAGAKDYLLRSWGDANAPDTIDGDAMPWTTSAPSATTDVSGETYPSMATVAHQTHTHTISKTPEAYRMGLILRTS